MDRSFLSQPEVVAVSREFVCARLSTYEDKDEAEFLATVFTGRSGQLENTVFSILAPDGETKLTRAGRSPQMALGDGRPRRGRPDSPGGEDVTKMVATLTDIAARYAKKQKGKTGPGTMPYVEDVRLGLNVAACDMLPTAIVVAKTDAAREALEKQLRPLAWADDFIGRLVWAETTKRKDLEKIAEVAADAALVIVQPDAFGLEGKVLAQTAKTDADSLEKALAAAMKAHAPGTKDAREHIREGRKKGVDWEGEVPVTDPHGPSRR